MKSAACIAPISTDCPFSKPSCFTMYSFARPISFFVAPLATEQISSGKSDSGTRTHGRAISTGSFQILEELSHTLYSPWLVFLSTSNVKASSQQSILISSSTRLLIFYFFEYLICPILHFEKNWLVKYGSAENILPYKRDTHMNGKRMFLSLYMSLLTSELTTHTINKGLLSN